jgi:hypothetical protein
VVVIGGFKPAATAVSSSLSTSCWNGIVPSGGLIAQHQSAPAAAFVPASADFGSFVGNTRIVVPKPAGWPPQVHHWSSARSGLWRDLQVLLYSVTAMAEVRFVPARAFVPASERPFGSLPYRPTHRRGVFVSDFGGLPRLSRSVQHRTASHRGSGGRRLRDEEKNHAETGSRSSLSNLWCRSCEEV